MVIVTMEDEFFDQFRNKDLSKIKRFDFKKFKAAKGSPTPPHSTVNAASQEVSNSLSSVTPHKSPERALPVQKLVIPSRKPKPTSTKVSNDIGAAKSSDTYLDSLYKSTGAQREPPAAQIVIKANSPSLLSGASRPPCNVSKYFTEGSPKKGSENASPFKRILQSKLQSLTVEESVEVKPKKFHFKNRLRASTASEAKPQPKEESTQKTVQPGKSLSKAKGLLVSESLDVNDADYMDDDEFERRFGGLAEPVEGIEQHKVEEDTKELLNEISNLAWDENVFEEEPQQGFKDRDDDSEEFRKDYEHSEVMMEVLHQKFGLREFRPHQREIINASLMQHDCFVLMPTGGGKSLCYQLPAILMPGVTVVISPLRALISDQVDKLNALDITAAHLCSDVSKSDSDQIYMKLSMREPGIKLLYLTPEKISASRIIIDMLNGLYQRGKLARFVIDEVHCLSQWGHDFRPDYKQLGLLRSNYGEVPIICLTATATKQVENDVINILNLRSVKRFIRSFNRPNIKYEVINKKGKATGAIAGLIKSKFPKKSGIVYCLSRSDCDRLADDFNQMGVKAKPYHAGMNDKVREAIQREWMQDRFHVIVATIAFGMGIDKPDVRFVIHNSIPKSVEAFYQESGRAGRDGEVSYSYLFYSYGDVGRLKRLMQMDRNMNKKTLEAHNENLKQMVSFAENVVDCRRYMQLIHLGEHFNRRICIENAATTCDNCQNIDKYKTIEVTKQAKELCTLVKDISGNGNFTLLHVADVYKGAKIKKIMEKGHNRHPLYGAGAPMDKTDVHRILKELILKHVLQDFCTYTGEFPVVYIRLGKMFYQFYNSDSRLTISVCNDKQIRQQEPLLRVSSEEFEDKSRPATASKEVIRHSVQKQNTAKLQAARKLQLAQFKVQCHEELLEECRRLAMERNLTLSSIMNLSAIKSMSDHLPASKEEMLKIQHVTVANYTKYGEFFLPITQKFREKYDALLPLTTLKSSPEAAQDEDDFRPSTSQSRGGSPSKKGVKRKGGWAGRRGGFKRKKPASKKGKKSASGSGWKTKGTAKGKSKASSIGLMPVHIM
ncbi:hypothetical protein HUJ04_013206 [Dendroctonus ponderosae]